MINTSTRAHSKFDSHRLQPVANHQHYNGQKRQGNQILDHETSKHLDIRLFNIRCCWLESRPSGLCRRNWILRKHSVQILRALQELCYDVAGRRHRASAPSQTRTAGCRRYTFFGLRQVRRRRAIAGLGTVWAIRRGRFGTVLRARDWV
jgi:hypothetical protein